MKCLFIGGKLHGQSVDLVPARHVTFRADGELYMGMQHRDDKGQKHTLYMLAGMAPADALKEWKGLTK